MIFRVSNKNVKHYHLRTAARENEKLFYMEKRSWIPLPEQRSSKFIDCGTEIIVRADHSSRHSILRDKLDSGIDDNKKFTISVLKIV